MPIEPEPVIVPEELVVDQHIEPITEIPSRRSQRVRKPTISR